MRIYPIFIQAFITHIPQRFYITNQGSQLNLVYQRGSEGTAYERTTVEVEGYGVVDVAYYPGYSLCSYIASTGHLSFLNPMAFGIRRRMMSHGSRCFTGDEEMCLVMLA